MTFWEWADKHPVAFVFALVVVWCMVPAVKIRWRSKGKDEVSK